MTFTMVGGTFTDDPTVKTRSGFFEKFTAEICTITHSPTNIINGGTLAQLDEIVKNELGHPSSIVLWMPNISNGEHKRLPKLVEVWKDDNTYLIQSKNNDRDTRYTKTKIGI